MQIIEGKGVSGSSVFGKIKLIRHPKNTEKRNVGSGDPKKELNRFREASQRVFGELETLRNTTLQRAGEKEADIFSIHQMMLRDDEFVDGVVENIHAGMSAEDAVKTVGKTLAARFSAMENSYMQARSADVKSVAERVYDVLSGRARPSFHLDSPAILVADDLSPAETMELDPAMVLGFVTEGGSYNSHTAILARTMDIPAIVGTGRISDSYDGADGILDGRSGRLYLYPDPDTLEAHRKQLAENAAEQTYLETLRGKTAVKSNGQVIRVCANTGSMEDVEAAVRMDAEGIGLFRSEFLFMQYGRCPTEEEQFVVYRDAVRRMAGRETVIRTLDAGADKQLPWLEIGVQEPNPALGVRAVRMCLRQPELLRTQLRALYRASAYGHMAVMIPMITIPEEVEKVQRIAKEVRDVLQKENVPYNPNMPVGIMIETPSAALYAETLAGMVDFFSIGTNDLIQYTMAADRENPAVAYLTAVLPESVKKLIRMTADAGRRAGIPVSVCGELGGDPNATDFLLQAGITKLSVSPARVLRVRAAVIDGIRRNAL